MAGQQYRSAEVESVMLGDFRQFHIALARRELAEARRGDDAWREYQTFTDNRFGKPVSAVKIFGKIEFASEALDEALLFIWTELQRLAARIYDRGDYLRSLRVYSPTGGAVEDLAALPPGAREVHFYPLVPYARKIELGSSSKARRGVFKPTFNKARARFGRSALITFSYVTPRESVSVNRTNRKPKKRGGSGAKYSAPIPVPIIRVRQGAFFS